MYRYMTRLAITGVWVLVGALVLLACAPGAPAARPAAPAAQPAAPTASGATPNSASDWDALVAAARAEGALALAGPSVAAHRAALMKFEETYPGIHVEYSGLAPADFEPRVAAERRADQYLWDVWVSGVSSTVYTRQIPQGWYDPIRPVLLLPEVLDDSKWLGGFEAGWMDNEKQRVYAFAANVSRSAQINRDLVPESAFNKLEDLLDPRWQGKIAMGDPRVRDAGSLYFAIIRRVLGDDAARRLLLDQQPALTTNARQLTEWVARGQYPIGIAVNTTILKELQDQSLGRNVQPLILPPQQTSLSPAWGAVLLMNRAPHPAAAKLFVNWLLSREAQSYWAEMGRVNSRRTDVPPGDADAVPEAAAFTQYVDLNSEVNAQEREEAIRFAQQILGS